MQELIESWKAGGTLHHAYLIEGDQDAAREALFIFLDSVVGHPTRGNPDFRHERADLLGIDEARAIIEAASVRPIAHPRKIFVIEVRTMTHQTQNALLKLFEEPAPDTHFFVVAPSADLFLPTLRSRLQVVRHDGDHRKGTLGKDFLAMTPAERSASFADILEEKDRPAAIRLLDAIIACRPSMLTELLRCRSYLDDTSASLKLVLEHVSAIL